MMFDSFSEELQSITKEASIKRVLQGAALGAVGAGMTGNDQYIPHAMAGGALLGTGFRPGGYNWRVPAWIGGLGTAGYYGSKALTKQKDVNQQVQNRYTMGIMGQRPSSPGQWM